MTSIQKLNLPQVGVGLRYPHYEQALAEGADIDFVEVHTENFHVDGGAGLAVLERARELYGLSFHCTALGLGSALGIAKEAVASLAELARRFDPMLVSDHLCFCWVDQEGRRVHAGDLLPVERNDASLAALTANIDLVQQAIGRPLLVENVTAYVDELAHECSETTFLNRLVERTGCRLLVDINNLLVNAHNQQHAAPIDYAKGWIDQIPARAAGEIHLAGYSATRPGEIAIDDHAAPVSEVAWQVYRHALDRFGPVPTLIEWDNALPDWQTLLQEALRARRIAASVFHKEACDG